MFIYMKMINEITDIIKESDLGIISETPKILIKIWLYYKLYWEKDYIIITRYYGGMIAGFILLDLVKWEIVIIAVRKRYRSKGFGTELIKKLPKKKIIVIHRKNHRSYNFFIKNKFKPIIDINHKQVLSELRK